MMPVGEHDIKVQQPNNKEFPKTEYCSYVDHRSQIHSLFRTSEGYKVASTMTQRSNPIGYPGCNVC